MSGYRQSGFDPNAGPRASGPPALPFDSVQWIGVALICLGVAIDVVFVGTAFGWWPKLVDSPVFAITPLMFGVIAVNSRREAVTDPAPELAAARRKWLAITVAICAVILGTATIFAMKGY